jgi:3-methyladenine DNA glycosylase AlkD
MFGVSYADLSGLAKKIQTNQTLAEELWATGNHDARILATMIADPIPVSDERIESWARDCANYVITDALSKLVARTPLCRQKAETWSASTEEYIGQLGWNLVGVLAAQDAELRDEYFRTKLEVLERDIHWAKNRVRHAMNGTLISIGLRNPALRELAIGAAQRIGKVVVDHGETGCETPDAVSYIQQAVAKREEMAARRAEAAEARKVEKPAAMKARKPAAPAKRKTAAGAKRTMAARTKKRPAARRPKKKAAARKKKAVRGAKRGRKTAKGRKPAAKRVKKAKKTKKAKTARRGRR